MSEGNNINMDCLPRIIAIVGRRRVGKDTLADFFVREHGYVKIKFATPLKDCVKHLFCFSDSQMEDDSKDLPDPYWNVTPRQVLQFVGTDFLQNHLSSILPGVGRRFLSISLLRRIREHPDLRYVVSDMRFLHEYNEITNAFPDCVTLRVRRNNTESCTSLDLHVSETESDAIPAITIDNDETVHELHVKAMSAIRKRKPDAPIIDK